jgi:hypothetical protein
MVLALDNHAFEVAPLVVEYEHLPIVSNDGHALAVDVQVLVRAAQCVHQLLPVLLIEVDGSYDGALIPLASELLPRVADLVDLEPLLGELVALVGVLRVVVGVDRAVTHYLLVEDVAPPIVHLHLHPGVREHELFHDVRVLEQQVAQV